MMPDGYAPEPPHDIEAEVCALGSMMLDASTIPLVQHLISADDFFRPANRLIFDAILHTQTERNLKMLDLVALKKCLVERQQFEKTGGIDYLDAIVNGVPSATNAEYYAGTVAEKSRLRKLIVLAGETRDEAYAPGAKSEQIITSLQEQATTLSINTSRRRTMTAYQAAQGVLERSEKVQRGELPAGLSLGFPSIDRCAGGLQPGEVVYVAGATSIGKTSLALKFALNVANGAGSVKLFSSEMSNADIAQRLLQMMSRVNGLKIQGGGQNVQDWDDTQAAAAQMKRWGAKVELTDEPMAVGRMESEIRSMASRLGRMVDLVIIDYLQITPSDEKGDIRARITAITRNCKLMAMRLQTSLIVLSQLNRSAQREKRPPELWDLKESSSIEQDADGVIMLWTPLQPQTAPQEGVVVWCRVAKWRNGKTTSWDGPDRIQLVFTPQATDYAEI